MFLPQAAADISGVGLILVDLIGDTKTAPAAGLAGTTGIQWEEVPTGYYWLVDRLSVRATSSAAPQVVITAGQRVMDNTYQGNFAILDESAPILVQAGESLGLNWKGLDPGQTPTVDAQYQLLRREDFVV